MPSPSLTLGVTVGTQFNNIASEFPAQTYSDAGTLGLAWLRGQVPWNKIETSLGNYSWVVYDAFVAACNAAGILPYLTIKQPPTWYNTQIVGGNSYPDPTGTALFATALATRYNGISGHGLAAGFEIGNEDYTLPGAASTGATAASAVLNAAVPALQAVVPPGTIIMPPATNQRSTAYTNTFYTGLYSGTNASALSALAAQNLHFYPVNPNPDPSITHSDFPSYDAQVTQICAIATAAGYSHPVWTTEINWTLSTNGGRNAVNIVTPANQWAYHLYCLDWSRKSGGLCTHYFPYSLLYNVIGTPASGVGLCDGMSLYQALSGPTMAFAGIGAYSQTYPAWPPATPPAPTYLLSVTDSVAQGLTDFNTNVASPSSLANQGMATILANTGGQASTQTMGRLDTQVSDPVTRATLIAAGEQAVTNLGTFFTSETNIGLCEQQYAPLLDALDRLLTSYGGLAAWAAAQSVPYGPGLLNALFAAAFNRYAKHAVAWGYRTVPPVAQLATTSFFPYAAVDPLYSWTCNTGSSMAFSMAGTNAAAFGGGQAPLYLYKTSVGAPAGGAVFTVAYTKADGTTGNLLYTTPAVGMSGSSTLASGSVHLGVNASAVTLVTGTGMTANESYSIGIKLRRSPAY